MVQINYTTECREKLLTFDPISNRYEMNVLKFYARKKNLFATYKKFRSNTISYKSDIIILSTIFPAFRLCSG